MATLIPSYELARHIGTRVEIEAETVDELIRIGVERYGEQFSKALRRTTIAVNGRSIHLLDGGATPLGRDDTVWLLTPAAGG